MTKDEAKSLAKRLRDKNQTCSLALREKCAAELRRLHEVNTELMEVLKRFSLYVAYNGDDWVQREAKAAIAKATGEQQ